MNRFAAFKTIARFALVLAAVVVVQGILSLKFQVFAYFDLPLIYSIYYGFTLERPVASLAIGSTLGLMQDSLSGAALGTNGFSKTLIGYLAASTKTRFDVEQPITRLLALVLFTFLDFALKFSLIAVVRPGDPAVYGISPSLWVLTAAFNALLGLILLGYGSRFRNATA
jgi:rod shape-determining protein MreD